MPFSSRLKNRIEKIVEKHETNLSALLPVLREVQNEQGWLSNESMLEVSETLGLPPSSVQNVATFYTMYFTDPVGKHVIWQCRTLSCALRGAEHLEHYLCEKLGIEIGETTEDGKITLMEAECLASCGTAPAILVDDKLYENVSKSMIDEIIENLKKS